jgi:hypothetical protein
MAIITVILVDHRGKETIIKVDTNDTILSLKEKYGNPSIQLIYDADVLQNEIKIGDYGIENYDKIQANPPSRGGEVGSAVKGFTDPTKVGPVRYATTTEGPDYLIVEGGINLFGICINKNCIAYKKEVSSPFGFGTFDLMKDLDPDSEKCPKCPSCEIPLLKLETCGFMLCKYKYNGKKIENDKLDSVNYEKTISEPDKVDYFDAGKNGENKSLWIELKITAYPL